MNFIMYFHHRLFPDPTGKPVYWKCSCGRTIFKANSQYITVSNDIGLPWESYPPGSAIIEIMCHSCKKNKYRIVFQ